MLVSAFAQRYSRMSPGVRTSLSTAIGSSSELLLEYGIPVYDKTICCRSWAFGQTVLKGQYRH